MTIKKNSIILLTLWIVVVFCKFSLKQSYSFKVFNQTEQYLYYSFLSPDGEQIMVNTVGKTQNFTKQRIVYFNGSIRCEIVQNDRQFIPQGWPLLIPPIHYRFNDFIIQKSDTLCGQYKTFADLNKIFGVGTNAFRNTSNQSLGSFYVKTDEPSNKSIKEYDLVKQTVVNTFVLENQDDQVWSMQYSPNGKYLYFDLFDDKVIVINTQTFQKIREIPLDQNLQLQVGNNDGKSYIAQNIPNRNYYHVDQNGNSTLVYNNSEKFISFGEVICTDDHLLVTLTRTLQTKLEMNVYNLTNNGQLVQNAVFSFGAYQRKIVCNNNYLVIIDQEGIAHVFNRLTGNQNDEDSDGSFPIWAIIAISVGTLAIVGVVTAYIICKRKKSTSQYQKFTNQKVKFANLD